MMIAGYKVSFLQKYCLYLMFFFLIGCSEDEPKETAGGVQMHPFEENIPHWDADHTPIDTSQGLEKAPESWKDLEKLETFLSDTSQFEKERLNIDVGNTAFFLLKAVTDNRFVLLDRSKHSFVEYNLSEDKSTSLADAGRGPGDIAFTEGIYKKDNRIFIAMGDGRISEFDCETRPCEHHQTERIDQSPNAITFDEDKIALLSTPSGMGGEVQQDKFDDITPVQVLDENGEELAGFGQAYDTEGHWMLIESMIGDGHLQYHPGQDLFILAYERFPFLYLYDAKNYELQEIYSITPFEIGKQEYDPATGRNSIVMEDYSFIADIKVVDDQHILVKTKKRTDFEQENTPQQRRNEQVRFDVVNLAQKESYYLGSAEFNDYADLYPTSSGLFFSTGGRMYEVR